MKMFKLCFYLSAAILLTRFNAYADNKTSAAPSANQNAPASFGDSAPDNRDLYGELERMRRDFDRLLQVGMSQAGRGLDWAQNRSGVYNPRMDLVEEKDRYVIKADIPGMDKSKLDVKVTDKSLTIAGERPIEKEKTDTKAGIYQQERNFGHFERTLPIPENVQKDKISAKYDLGVLTIELPKINPSIPEADNARKIQIQ